MIHYQLSAITEIIHQGNKKLFGGRKFWFFAEMHKIRIVRDIIYCELVEIGSHNQIKAKIKGILFQKHVWENFIAQTQIDTNQVKNSIFLLQGTVNHHKEYGISIIIQAISTEYTQGKIQQNKKNILQQLQKEGIAGNNKKLHIPQPPYHIALVSGQESQGERDFSSILQNSPFSFIIKKYETIVHGDKAKENILQILQQIQKEHNQKPFTHIVITRGGGESTGMLWQNDYDLAKTICLCPIPVVIAVGHTSDISILDSISYAQARTPSEAAALCIQRYQHRSDKINATWQAIQQSSRSRIMHISYHIRSRTQQIKQGIQQHIQQYSHTIEKRLYSIQHNNPQKVMEQGYALLKKNNTYITKEEINKLKTGEELDIETYEYTLKVTVQKIKKKDNK